MECTPRPSSLLRFLEESSLNTIFPLKIRRKTPSSYPLRLRLFTDYVSHLMIHPDNIVELKKNNLINHFESFYHHLRFERIQLNISNLSTQSPSLPKPKLTINYSRLFTSILIHSHARFPFPPSILSNTLVDLTNTS